jgi:hypothetical protein
MSGAVHENRYGLPLSTHSAEAAAAGGNLAARADHLEPVLSDVVRIGGSHAQRELVEDTLIVAPIRAGRTERARAVLDAHLHRRPSARDTRWQAASA